MTWCLARDAAGVGMPPLLMTLPRPGEVPMSSGYGAGAAPVSAAREPGNGGPYASQPYSLAI